MYKVTIPATTILNTQTYDVNCTYLCDETCRRFPFDEHGNFSYDETLSASQNFNLDDAMRRIRYKLNELARNFNPWQFDIDLYSDPSHNTFGAVGNMFLNAMNITVHELPATEFTYDFSNGRSINALPLTNGGSNPYANLDSQLRAGVVFYDGTPNCSFSYEITFLPNDIFRSGMISEDTNNCVRFSISISAIKGQLPGTIERISGFSINAVKAPPFSTTTGQFYVAVGLIGQYMSDLNTEMLGGNSDSPYEVIPAGFGGGDGTFNLGSGTIDDPEIPTIDAVSTGLLTIFAPTLSQVQQLGDYMWSSA